MKVYIKKVSNKTGKELFKGEKTILIYIRKKGGKKQAFNLIGNYTSFKPEEEIDLWSATTQNWISFGEIIEGTEDIVNEDTKHAFAIIK